MVYIPIYTASWPLSRPDKKALFQFDLQLFSEEKTEEATPKRQEEARNKGQVAKSAELNAVFAILTAFITLKLVGSYIYNELTEFMKFMFMHVAANDLTIDSAYRLYIDFTIVFFKAVLPVMAMLLIISLAINCLQVGFVISFEPLLPQLSRINPITGMQRLFSKRSLVELGKSLAKIAVVGVIIYRFGRQHVNEVTQLVTTDLAEILTATASLAFDLAIQIGGALLVLAVADYFYQWWENRENLRMSKQEVKQEMKETEGDPQIRGKIKERQRAMAMRRMMQDVPAADVIITNPTHLAVALKYDKAMSAPVVVAKGADLVAAKIREIAREHHVTIVENKPLARSLYAALDIGQAIPPELYQAVAEVLAYVFRLKKRLS